jgi:uncharacterized alpha-E superfamily protein
MLSRVAESIYWMNRYVERAENNARYLEVNFNMLLDKQTGFKEQWEPLLITTATNELFKEVYDSPSRENVIEFIGFNLVNPNSILSCISQARENARSIRENLTKETWEQVNNLYLIAHEKAVKKRSRLNDPRKFFEQIKHGCQLLRGIADNTVSRNIGWHFGKVGQYLERADNTSRILDVKYHILLPSIDLVGSTIDIIQWANLLRSVSGYNIYRREYGKILPIHIAEFLVLNRQFPRAILFSVQFAENSMLQISGGERGHFRNDAEKFLGKVRAELEYADMEDIFAEGLHEYLDNFQKKIINVSSAFQKVYFRTTNN